MLTRVVGAVALTVAFSSTALAGHHPGIVQRVSCHGGSLLCREIFGYGRRNVGAQPWRDRGGDRGRPPLPERDARASGGSGALVRAVGRKSFRDVLGRKRAVDQRHQLGFAVRCLGRSVSGLGIGSEVHHNCALRRYHVQPLTGMAYANIDPSSRSHQLKPYAVSPSAIRCSSASAAGRSNGAPPSRRPSPRAGCGGRRPFRHRRQAGQAGRFDSVMPCGSPRSPGPPRHRACRSRRFHVVGPPISSPCSPRAWSARRPEHRAEQIGVAVL